MLRRAKSFFIKVDLYIRQDSRGWLVFWGGLLVLMLIKYYYYGIRYFPVLDDYNMYGTFYPMSPVDVLKAFKMYTNRPTAALLDAFILSRLWKSMWIPLLAMILLHFATCYLVWRIFKKNRLEAGIVSLAVFALSPFGTEAAYWIAASSRIIAGLFFVALALYFLMLFIEIRERNQKNSFFMLILFSICELVSLGFYEQITVLGFACPLVVLFINRKRLKLKWPFVLPFANLAAFLAYYMHFSNLGPAASRSQLVKGDILLHTAKVLKIYVDSIIKKQWTLYKRGISRGMELIFREGKWPLLMAVVLFTVMIILIAGSRNESNQRRSFWIKFLTGAMLTAIPMAPFFILESTWIANRNVFISFFGLGLMLESVVELPGYFKIGWGLKHLFVFFLVIFSMVVNFSEMADYRQIWLLDQEITGNYAEVMKTHIEFGPENKGAALFNTKPRYADLTLAHFSNCTAADWAFMGAFYVLHPEVRSGYIATVPDGGYTTVSADNLKKYVYLGINDQKEIFPLMGEWQGEDRLILFQADGTEFGTVDKVSGNFRFRLTK